MNNGKKKLYTKKEKEVYKKKLLVKALRDEKKEKTKMVINDA